ncbi:SWI SNF, matrix associated, actin dependent regulator of chromatin, sub d, member 3 [Kappamyces sp. JEL0829]|nr:SWI SNF, matrix associated, actin dependent regulator of chromatin, sub d, member 3 [Kappamyces sp. JEL0829]
MKKTCPERYGGSAKQQLEAYVPESKIYMQMQDFERRLDATISRKMLDIHDSLAKPPKKTTRTMRLFLSNTAANQSVPGTDDPSSLLVDRSPSWTFKIEGRLLDIPNVRKQPENAPKFSALFKKVVIEIERDAKYPGNIVEWNKSPSQPEMDGFELKRRGDAEVDLKILLYLDSSPEKHKLAPALANLLDLHTDTVQGVILAIWQYVKTHKLQDPEDRRVIACDEKMQKVFQMPKIPFQNLPSILTRHLFPCDPVSLSYTVRVDKDYHMGTYAFDIQVEVPDSIRDKQAQAAQINPTLQREIQTLDDKIAALVQTICMSKLKRDFMQSFSQDPVGFINQWTASQSRDLEVMLGDTRINLEEAQSTQFFENENFQEALFHYLRSKEIR